MKITRRDLSVFILTVSLLSTSCGSAPPSNNALLPAPAQTVKNTPTETPPVVLPPLPVEQKIENGGVVYKVRLAQNDDASDVWIYLPEKNAGKKLPVVLVTAAGSYLWNGTALGEGDQPEHLPYVRKGYAVVAYETPGSLDEVDLDTIPAEQLLTAVRDFKNSKAGLVSQQNALNYALEKVAALDAERIYVAGHSSAATHALLVAASEPRVKAAIAYAPATDLEKRLATIIEPFDTDVPGFREFISQSSPKNNISKIKVPVFIFHAKDDSVVPIEDTRIFAAELKKSNPQVVLVEAESGDHYDSMIGQGIGGAIEWLNKISGAARSSRSK